MTPLARPNPYVGPRAFQYGETLYGRDREVMELLDLLIAERIVLLYSPSGAGKTSLIQAALIPELEQEEFRVLPVMRVSLEPPLALDSFPMANRYILSLLLSLEEALPVEQQLSLAELAGMELADYLERQQRVSGGPDTEVLIFDQFEEILTVDPTDRSAKEAFFAQVGVALRNRQRWALFAMREEYPAGLDPYLRPIPTRFSTTYRLELLGEEAARVAVQRPARQAGVDFTDVAATKLINDLRQVRIQRPGGTTEERLGLYVEPVQLQVVCRRLWETLPPDATQIREADVEKVGDVDRALSDYYAERVAAIARQTGVGERAIREWFDHHLITTQGIRGQVLQGPNESQGLDNRAIRSLVDAHLVRAEERRGATWFELAHDRLIEPVRQNNAAWFQANLSALQRQAALWEEQHRAAGLLLRGEALQEAERWATEHQEELTPTERDFLDACREARTQAERERRQARHIRWLAIGASIVSVIASLLFFWALTQRRIAIQQGRIALSRELAATAISRLRVDPELSVLLATEAMRVTPTGQAEDALRQSLPESHVHIVMHGHGRGVKSAVFSPDAQFIVTASDDATARVWEASSGQLRTILQGHTREVRSAVFSPDSHWVVTAGDTTARVWEVSTGRQIAECQVPAGFVSRAGREVHEEMSIAMFSPDGKFMVTASEIWTKQNNTVTVWETQTWQSKTPLRKHTGKISSIAFSPNGQLMVTASEDNTAWVWRIDTVSAEGTSDTSIVLRGHVGPVKSATFSPDSKFIVTAGADRRARVWIASTGRSLAELRGHTDKVMSAAFSPDGKWVITAGDMTARVWAWQSLPILHVLHRYTSSIGSIAFSLDGKKVVTAGDRTAHVWKTSTGESLLVLKEHTGPVWMAVFSPDGKFVATTSQSEASDDTARVWDVSTGSELHVLRGHTGWAGRPVFSPNSKYLVTTGQDGTARVWDVSTGNALHVLRGHTGSILRVAFSPDGQRVVTTGEERAQVWEVSSGRRLSVLGTCTEENKERGLCHSVQQGHTQPTVGASFSPSGEFVITASQDGTARVWDVSTGQNLAELRGHTGVVTSAKFSPDGKWVVTASLDNMALAWNAASGEIATELSGHADGVESAAFSPDGKFILTVSKDKTAQLWEASTGRSIALLDEVENAAFSPDGRLIATTKWDKTVQIYACEVCGSIEELLALAPTRVTRGLTKEERNRYLSEPARQ